MKNKKKNNKKGKMLNRDQLIKFVEGYNKLNSVRNKIKRFRKNQYKFSIIKIFIPIILAFVIGIISLMFFKAYINDFTIFSLIIIVIIVMVILVKKNLENLENFYPKKMEIWDEEIFDLLKKNNLEIKDIKNIIKYIKLDIEYEKLLNYGSPVINNVSNFWNKLFFVILGAVISNFFSKEFTEESITLFVGILLIGGLILTVKVWNHFEQKSSYLNRIQKLVLDLKQIELLYNDK